MPLAVLALGLASCNNRANTFIIRKSNNIKITLTAEKETATFDTYGYKDLSVKKNTMYNFVYDFGSAPIYHNMGKEIGGEDDDILNSFIFGFNVDKEQSHVSLNGVELKGKAHGETGNDYDFEFARIEEEGIFFGNGVVFNNHKYGKDSGRYTWKTSDKITLSLKCNEDISDVAVCAFYQSLAG